MDLSKYDELRNKINKKDFEGNNKGLDKWLFGFSFVGNFASIFFSYFLVYPALLKAISINLFGGIWAAAVAFLFTNVFLVIYEIIKRYLAKNFSSDYVANGGKIKAGMVGWFTALIAILVLSFYLSLTGSKNLATTSIFKNNIAQTEINITRDNLTTTYESEKVKYEIDNENLRSANNDLRQKQINASYMSSRNDLQKIIDKNTGIINSNQAEIKKIDQKLAERVEELKSNLNTTKTENKNEDTRNIILFIIIAVFAEIIIVIGVYFREWFEYNLWMINHQKFEKAYIKKDRYRSLISFIYGEGKVVTGDKVISGLELKELVRLKTTIPNSNKFVDEFLRDMDGVGVFNTIGKRRFIAVSYAEALNIVDKFDDTLRILENMK